jgi:uncharacterized OsmC-like protein
MKIVLRGENAIRLEPVPGPLTIESAAAEDQYSPFHMLASGLATCTFSVLHSWATHARLDVGDLSIDVAWEFSDRPHRVGDMRVSLDWPSLPPQRRAAAERVAEMCTIHATLTHPPAISVKVAGGAAVEVDRTAPVHREPAARRLRAPRPVEAEHPADPAP